MTVTCFFRRRLLLRRVRRLDHGALGVATALTISLSEYLRVKFGVHYIGMAETIYGLVLVIFIIFLPSGIYGSLRGFLRRPRVRADARA